MTKNILLIDDDEALAELVGEYLLRFDFAVQAAVRPAAGLIALKRKSFKAVILDVMLPEMDGFETCKIIRRDYPRLPILMLTARGDLTDRVVGLELGADDYLSKPFEPRELVARLSALLRRSDIAPMEEEKFSFAELTVNLTRRHLWISGEDVLLSGAEFRVLAALIRARPAIVRRDDLIEAIRGFERELFDRSIDIAVSRLRAKINDSPKNPRFIQTVRGEGYSFIGADE